MLSAVALIGAILTQHGAAIVAADRLIPTCAQTRCAGKAIKDNLGVLQFCVPRGVNLAKAVGEHGDVHYTVTAHLHGESFELFVVSGPYFSGKLPDRGRRCDLRKWHSPEWKGEDCRVIESAGRSRYVTLNTPMGYAEYRDAPPEVAIRFDRILDSLCWASLAK